MSGARADQPPKASSSIQGSCAQFGDADSRGAKSREKLAEFLQQRGKLDEAERLLRENLETCRANSGEDSATTLESRIKLADFLQQGGKLDEAEFFLRENLETCCAQFGDADSRSLQSREKLADFLQQGGKLDEAERLLRENLETCRTNMGASHPDTVSSRDCLLALLRNMYTEQRRVVTPGAREVFLVDWGEVEGGHDQRHVQKLQTRDEQADQEQQLIETLQSRRHELGWQHPRTQQVVEELAGLLRSQSRLREVTQLYRDRGQGLRTTRRFNISVRHSGSGEEICEVRVSESDLVSKLLATVLEAAGREDGHLLLKSEVLDENVSLKDAGLWIHAEVFLVAVREADGSVERKKQLERILRRREQHLGINDPKVASTLQQLGNVLEELQEFEEMAKVLGRCLEIQEGQPYVQPAKTAATRLKLAVAHGQLGEHRKEVGLLELCRNIQEQRALQDDSARPDLEATLFSLGVGYGHLGEFVRKVQTLERGLKMVENDHGPEHPKLVPFLKELGSAYGDLGDDALEKRVLERCASIQARREGRGASRAQGPKTATETAVTYDKVDGLAVRLGQRDFAQIRHGVVMISRRYSRARFEISELEECPKLPANVCPLSPILKLLPHETRFEEGPVLLIIRVCSGAEAVWRSSSDGGWESLPDAMFYPGHAVLWLDHFCELFVGTDGTCSPRPRGMLVRGFMDGTTRRGKCAVLHTNCPSCTQQLQPTSDYRVDPEVLRGFDECGPPFCAGLYSHGDKLTIAQAENDHQHITLSFHRLPLVTSRFFEARGTQFEVDIADSLHAFRLCDAVPTAPANLPPPAPLPPPPPQAGGYGIPPPPPSPHGQEDGTASSMHLILPEHCEVEVYTAEEPHSFLSTGELQAGRLPIEQLMQRARADSAEDGSLLVQVLPPPPPPPPPPAEEHQTDTSTDPPPPPAPPESSQRRNLMISGRFNDQHKINYMRQIKEALCEQFVPVDMVKADFASAEFGNQTALLLYRAKALLAFCTWDYGAKTGAQYETYKELEYAHQNKLAILPIQLCREFPPCPKDEEGRAQNVLVLKRDLVRIFDEDMSDPARVAQEICDAWFRAIQHM
ncbi:nphp3 [Symbiodinium sp. CCMP2592]|nr:nphp3 [Symbiodinium sp. CCMP2592]